MVRPLVLTLLSIICLQFASYGQTDSIALLKKELKPKRKKQYTRPSDDIFQPLKKSWSVGVHGGYPMVVGDIPPDFGVGYGLDIRKALGYSVSLRLQAINGYCTGIDWQRGGENLVASNVALNGTNNPALNYNQPNTPIYQNFKMDFTQVNFQILYNLNNINFMRQNPKFNTYLLLGGGGMIFQTYIDQLDANGKMYDYSKIPDIDKNGGSKSSVYSALKSLRDGKYETKADIDKNGATFAGENLVPVITAGIGVEYKISDRISWSLELIYGFTGSDALDGARWYGAGIPTSQADAFGYINTGIHIRLGKTENAYWFSNPLSMPYETILDSKRRLMRVDKIEKDMGDLKVQVDSMGKNLWALTNDRDSDGVADYFDKEDSTPVSSIVDGAGRTIFFRDADGNIVFNDPSAVKGDEGDHDPDGTTYRNEDDGSKTKVMPDGNEYKNSPDGSSYKSTKSGHKLHKAPDGKIYGVNASGQEDEIQFDELNAKNPKVKTSRDKDGNTIKVYPNGNKYKITKDGTIYKTYPDGTTYKKTKDGQVYLVNTNGDEDEVEFRDATPNPKKARPTNARTKFDAKDLSNKITMMKSNGKGGYISPGVSSALGYMPAIFFDTDKSDIKYTYYPELFSVANNLKNNPGVKVRVVGYCDYRSSEQYNYGLGMRRANAVVNTLVNYFGVPAGQLTAESKGKLEPLTNLKGWDALAANRRAQFAMDEKGAVPAKKSVSSSNSQGSVAPAKEDTKATITPIGESNGNQNGAASETPAPAKAKPVAKKSTSKKHGSKTSKSATANKPVEKTQEPDLYGPQNTDAGTATKKFETNEPSSNNAVSSSEVKPVEPAPVAVAPATEPSPAPVAAAPVADNSTPSTAPTTSPTTDNSVAVAMPVNSTSAPATTDNAVAAPAPASTDNAASTPAPASTDNAASTPAPASTDNAASTPAPVAAAPAQDDNTVNLNGGSITKDKAPKKTKAELAAEKKAFEKMESDRKAEEKKKMKELKAAKKKAAKEAKKRKKKGIKDDKIENMNIPGE